MRLTGAAAYAAASIVLAATTAVVVSADKDVVFAPKMTRNTRRASYIGKLMDAARPTPNSRRLHTSRHLEDGNDIDLSSYAIKFEKCQNVKQYAYQQNGNNNNNDDTVLETKKFVIFRLCPVNGSSSSSSGGSSSSGSSASSSCSSCDSKYGEYIVDMDTYLQATVQHKQEEQEQYCEVCDECANAAAAANDDAAAAAAADDDGGGRRHLRSRQLTSVDCDTCYATCQNIDNMEANGYADASEYIQCEKVYENENKNIVYYAGAVCTNYGTRIKVGLFTDEDCTNYDSNAAIDQYIKNQNGYNVKLSYHLLKQTFASDACVASCAVAAEDDNDDGDANVAETAEICQNLYEASGKCESPNGFASGMSSSSNYEVQSNNEEIVCDYISNIYAGHYDESGEVTADSKGTLTIFGGRKTVKNTTTRISGGQKFALSFFTIGTIGLVSYALLLRRKLARANKEPFVRS